MKSTRIRFLSGLVIALLLILSGCEIIGGIFKAGVGVGVFVVILVLAIILFLISKMRKN